MTAPLSLVTRRKHAPAKLVTVSAWAADRYVECQFPAILFTEEGIFMAWKSHGTERRKVSHRNV